MPVVVLFLIFVALLVIAVPVSITLGITSVLPSVFDPSFTVGAKYLIRAMFGGLDSFRSGDRCRCRKHDNPDSDYPWL